MTRIERAIAMALKAHGGQTDKAGQPYILHPLAVCSNPSLQTEDERIVAILHDVLEDTDTPAHEIYDEFGQVVLDAVLAITHAQGEPNIRYWAQVKLNPIALKVKLADITHNLSPGRLAILPEPDRERVVAKYTRALAALKG